VYRQAEKYGVPRIAFVNKMDRTGANFANVVKDVRTKLGAPAFPILIPIGAEENLIGQIDVVNQKAIIYSDDEKFGSKYTVRDLQGDEIATAKAAYDELMDAACSADDELGMIFLEERPITPVELKAGLRRAVISNKIIPIAGGSAFKNKGVQYLIDAVIDYLPGPLDIVRIAHSIHHKRNGRSFLREFKSIIKNIPLKKALTNGVVILLAHFMRAPKLFKENCFSAKKFPLKATL
jgi:elongation factor G